MFNKVLILSLILLSPLILFVGQTSPYVYIDTPRSLVLNAVVGFLLVNNLIVGRLNTDSKFPSKNLTFSFNLTFVLTLLLCFSCIEIVTRWWLVGEVASTREIFIALSALICGMLVAFPISTSNRLQIFSRSPITLSAILTSILAPYFVWGWHVLISFWVLVPAFFILLIKPLAATFLEETKSAPFKRNDQKSNRSSSEENTQEKQNSYEKTDSFERNKDQSLDDDLKFFNLTKDYSFEELKSVRNEQLKMNHPDKVAHLSEEIQELAQQQTKLINEVYERLLARLNSDD